MNEKAFILSVPLFFQHMVVITLSVAGSISLCWMMHYNNETTIQAWLSKDIFKMVSNAFIAICSNLHVSRYNP